MPLRFRFSTVPFLATVALVALGLSLGNWQVRRAAEKTALQARLEQRTAEPPLVLDGRAVDPAAVEYRRVTVSGSFIPNWTLFLDNRPLDGRTGVVVVTPFRIAGSGKVVLVERGWMARGNGEHGNLAPPALPTGPQTIAGLAVRHVARVLQLGTAAAPAPGALVQNLDPAAVAQASRLDVLPVLVEQTGADPADGADAADNGGAGGSAGSPGARLVRKWPPPAVDVDRHRGYAVTWYGLTAMTLLFYVITGFRRGSKQG